MSKEQGAEVLAPCTMFSLNRVIRSAGFISITPSGGQFCHAKLQTRILVTKLGRFVALSGCKAAIADVICALGS